jgi:hypothetical protein
MLPYAGVKQTRMAVEGSFRADKTFGRALALDDLHDLQEALQRAGEPVILDDHHGVTGAALVQEAVGLGTVPGRSGDGVGTEAPCPGRRERVMLAVEKLLARRHTRIAQDQGQNPPRTSAVFALGSVPVKPL